MRKKTYIVLLLLALVATACGSASNANSTNRSFNRQNGSATTGELPATTQLIIGTLKLEGTDQVVTAKQANDLLPLWQTMKVLSESDTAAQQEKDALISQIQETMTPKQMQAITDMKLTRADMFTFLQGQGAVAGNNSTSSTGGQNSNSQNRNSSSSSRRSGQGGGFFAGGGPSPDGGFSGGAFGGQGQNARAVATAQASRQQRSGSFLPPALINALIEYLQKKAGA